MNKKAVVFDFNGTLFYDSDKHIKAWNIYAERLIGRELTDEEVMKMLGRTNRLILKLLLKKEPSDEMVAKIGAEKERLYRKLCFEDISGCKLAPGAPELLDKLAAADVKLAIATSSDAENVEFYFKYFGIDKWFTEHEVIYNDGTIAGKPNPDIYLKSMERLNVLPNETVVFEDAVAGVRAAKAANVGKVIGVLSVDNKTELEAAGVDETIRDYYDIVEIAQLLR